MVEFDIYNENNDVENTTNEDNNENTGNTQITIIEDDNETIEGVQYIVAYLEDQSTNITVTFNKTTGTLSF